MIKVVQSENKSLWFVLEVTAYQGIGRSANLYKTIHKVFMHKYLAENYMKGMRHERSSTD